MKWREWLAQWSLDSLKLSLGTLQMEFSPNDVDREAAWEMYVELLTRVTTQDLVEADGDEQGALASVHSLFGVTRDILRRKGPNCIEFTKLAVVVLNQIVRPFTSKWHRISLHGGFQDPAQCKAFRAELRGVQTKLSHYTRALAALANVEDLTTLEDQRELLR